MATLEALVFTLLLLVLTLVGAGMALHGWRTFSNKEKEAGSGKIFLGLISVLATLSVPLFLFGTWVSAKQTFLLATSEVQEYVRTVNELKTESDYEYIHYLYPGGGKTTEITCFTCEETGDVIFRCPKGQTVKKGDKLRFRQYESNGKIVKYSYEAI